MLNSLLLFTSNLKDSKNNNHPNLLFSRLPIKIMATKEMMRMNRFVTSVEGLMRTLTRTQLIFIIGRNARCLRRVGNVNKSLKSLCWMSIWLKSARTLRSTRNAISAALCCWRRISLATIASNLNLQEQPSVHYARQLSSQWPSRDGKSTWWLMAAQDPTDFSRHDLQWFPF